MVAEKCESGRPHVPLAASDLAIPDRSAVLQRQRGRAIVTVQASLDVIEH